MLSSKLDVHLFWTNTHNTFAWASAISMDHMLCPSSQKKRILNDSAMPWDCALTKLRLFARFVYLSLFVDECQNELMLFMLIYFYILFEVCDSRTSSAFGEVSIFIFSMLKSRDCRTRSASNFAARDFEAVALQCLFDSSECYQRLVCVPSDLCFEQHIHSKHQSAVRFDSYNRYKSHLFNTFSW